MSVVDVVVGLPVGLVVTVCVIGLVELVDVWDVLAVVVDGGVVVVGVSVVASVAVPVLLLADAAVSLLVVVDAVLF